MNNLMLQTHIEECYVCFLPSQISQISSLITKHHKIIKAQYPLRGKKTPYYVVLEEVLFLFIPVQNVKNIELLNILELIQMINKMNVPHLWQYEIHLSLLQKYLKREYIEIIKEAVDQLLLNNFRRLDKELSTFNKLSYKTVQRILCLVDDEHVQIYEKVPSQCKAIKIIITDNFTQDSALIKAVNEGESGVIIVYFQKQVNNDLVQSIAYNGNHMYLHQDNYFNILYDIYHYARQYRLPLIILKNNITAGNLLIELNSYNTELLNQYLVHRLPVQFNFRPPNSFDSNHLNDVNQYFIDYKMSDTQFITFNAIPQNSKLIKFLINNDIT